MGKFQNEIFLKPLNETRWELAEPLEYKPTVNSSMVVPAGFVTDFASVPRVFWSIIPPWGKYGRAAILHDYLYSAGDLPRKVCDKIFLQAMVDLEVVWWRRKTMYRIVRWFGKKAWEKHRMIERIVDKMKITKRGE